jgi:hypothetical protein
MWVADPDGLRIGIIEVPPQHPLRRDPAADRQAAPRDGEGWNRLQRDRTPITATPAAWPQ